jgi:TP901 family phage tail tape measure protein
MAVAASAVGALLASAFIPVVKVAADFEQEMKNVESVLLSSSDLMGKMGDLAVQVGRDTIYSAKQAAEGFYNLASAGYKVNEVISALPPIVDLAIATQFNMNETTKLIIVTMKAFGLEMEETARVTNTFAAATIYSQARIEMFWKSMAYVAPVAKSAGISLEEVVTALSLLYDAGFSATLAATALRGAFDIFIRETPRSTKILQTMGLTFKDIDMKTKGFVGALESLKKAGATTEQIFGLFKIRAAPAIMALLNRGIPAFKEFESKITGTRKASEMAAVQMDTVKASVIKLGNQFQNLFIRMAAGSMGPIKVLVTGFSNMVIGVTDLLTRVPALTNMVGGLVTVLTSAALALGAVLGAIVLWAKASTLFMTVWAPWMWWVIGISAALGGLVWILATLAKKQELSTQQMEEETEAIKLQGDELDKLAKRWNELSDIQDKNNIQIQEMYSILGKLRDRYPSLTSELSKLGIQTQITAELLEKLNDAQTSNLLFTQLKQRETIISDINASTREMVRTPWEEFPGKLVAYAEISKRMDDQLKSGKELSELDKERLREAAREDTVARASWEEKRGRIASLMDNYKRTSETIMALEEVSRKRGIPLPSISETWAKVGPPPLEFPGIPSLRGDISGKERYRAYAGPEPGAKKELPAVSKVTNISVNINGPVPEKADARNLARDIASRIEEVVERGEE